MPELPEVETVVRTLRPHIQNCVFKKADLLRQSILHPLSLPLDSLCGLRIANASRRGKLIVLHLEKTALNASSKDRRIPEFLIVHLKMTGRLFTHDANEAQGRHTRCVFLMENPDGNDFQLFFDDTRAFGKILAATPQILQAWPFWSKLGPEPLEIDAKDFAARFSGSRSLKSALLDQEVVAGIGNIYADEALFKSGLHPGRPANSLSQAEYAKLLVSLQKILKLSISQCGSSIRDYRDADGNAGAFQNTFMAYGRGGQACKKCGSPMQKTRIGGRATVFCPTCQK